MPLYEFQCDNCGPFTELRRLSECDMPAECPVCGSSSSRIISVPRLAIMEKNNRTAWERNEKSAHEPRRVNAADRHHHHDGGHKHEHHHHHTHKHGAGGRPWMIGH